MLAIYRVSFSAVKNVHFITPAGWATKGWQEELLTQPVAGQL